MHWTPAIDTILKGLRNEGLTGQQIGDRMGISRGAVLGRCMRLKLPQVAKPGKPTPEAPTNQPLGILQLAPGMCRFPVQENPYLFCAAPAERAWCPHHRSIVYRGKDGQY